MEGNISNPSGQDSEQFECALLGMLVPSWFLQEVIWKMSPFRTAFYMRYFVLKALKEIALKGLQIKQ